MPSVVDVTLFTGPATLSFPIGFRGTPTHDIAVLYFRWADNNLEDNSDPIIPGAGTVYSWAKTVHLHFTAPPDNEATNLRFFQAAGNFDGEWAGVSLLCGIDPSEGLYMRGNTSDQAAARDGLVVHLVGDVLVLNAGVIFENDIGYPVPGYAAAYNVVTQIVVPIDTPKGQTSPLLLTYRFSET